MELKGYKFPFVGGGVLHFDPGKETNHFDPYWLIVNVNEDIANYYRWHLERYGQATYKPNRLW